MTVSVVIAAAGNGSRAQLNTNKLLSSFGGKPVIWHTVNAFAERENVNEIIVTIPADLTAEFTDALNGFNCKLIVGGETRFASVKKGVLACSGDIVLIHDGARPYVSKELIDGCINSTVETGSGICALPCADTVALAASGGYERIDRDSLRFVQTPQGFKTELLKKAYRLAKRSDYTDESFLYSDCICAPTLCNGSKRNVKLTYREDFQQPDYRVGTGIDIHAVSRERDYIVLGGVTINCGFSMRAHSDGDVLAHALMDAMLSAAGLCDIGHYFPDTDIAYKGINSFELLKKVDLTIAKSGFKLCNISCAIQAEKPKLADYLPQMKRNLADALALDADKIGITAGTNEGVGNIGRGEAIAVTASVCLIKI